MKHLLESLRFIILTSIFICTATIVCSAQKHLSKKVTVNVSRQPISVLFAEICKQGKFEFSYNSNLINGDSIVTISAINKPVQSILNQVFAGKYHYKERGNHIIIQKDPNGHFWYLSGYIVDAKTGERIRDVSVYEKNQLVASLTDEDGYFQLKLKDKNPTAQIGVSKSWYVDTAIVLQPGYNQEITLSIKPESFLLDSVVVNSVEETWWANFLLSSKQKMQGLNLGKFFVDKPYQASIIPGVSTHGKMSAQTINKVSFNLLGGYTTGVEGVEIGGLFNINKRNVNYAQIAGLFNIVGGQVKGAHVAGLYNFVLDTTIGVQVSGISSMTQKSVIGIQASGLYSHVREKMIGIQASGLVSLAAKGVIGLQASGLGNIAGKEVDGSQISGFFNISTKEINGGQVTGFVNVAKRVDGAQVGFINIADTSSGVSIGFLNIQLKGYHKLAIYYNEAFDFNASIKTGSKRFYNIFTASANPSTKDRAFAFGYGIGMDIPIGKTFSIACEGVGKYLYLGNWDNSNFLMKINTHLNVKVWKYLTLFAGPTYNIYYSNQATQIITTDFTYKYQVPRDGYGVTTIDDESSAWIGINAGIMIF
ncbi:MAG: STN and carboxypeptidase regulatory-like domain-containing protein [Flavipsychrobacter sp.]